MVRSTGLRKVNIAVFISGTGSNLFKLIKYSKLKNSKYSVKCVFSDKKNAGGLKFAKKFKIPYEILNLLNNNLINGCANITGGGVADNLKRIIPENLTAEIDLSKIKVKKIFNWLKKQGISDKEMLKTFNCGVGFCLIINQKKFNKIQTFFDKDFKPYVIGKISKMNGQNRVKLNGKINWS